jgi:tetratricopeptide (TPR) repeat protein
MFSLGVWSNHFEAVFQDNDFHVIVNNRAIQDLANIPHFFKNPRLYADQPELAEYRPLALVSLALDNWLARPVNPSVFDADAFLWFILDVFVFALLCVLIPAGGWRRALFVVALFAFHPVVGETLNYASRRGDLMGALGVLTGLVFWIVWPRLLPAKVIEFHGVPKTGWDEFRRVWSPRINGWYRSFVEAPLQLYLIPVALGLLADPGAAVFPLLLLAYILVFDRDPKYGKPWRRVLPSALVCGLYWAAQLAFTWKYAAGYRLPALDYWITQPWVVLRYLWIFLVPVNIAAVSDLRAFPHIWSPLALVGIAGLAGLVVFTRWLGKKEEWRTSAFGLWWFLIALLPSSLVPQRAAEADYRMFLPLMGLAIATVGAGWLLYRRYAAAARSRFQAVAVCASVTAVLLAVLCWLTYTRTEVFKSQQAFWEDVVEVSPGSGRAFIEYGVVLRADGQVDRGYASLMHAVSLISASQPAAGVQGDAPDELLLARAFDLFGKDQETVDHFHRALQANPNYAQAWSRYSHWLLLHDRIPEAVDAAQRALKISPWDTEAQHSLLEFYSRTFDWPDLKKQAETLLAFDPTDEDARRSLEVAEAGFTSVRNAEETAKNQPSVDDFLALSVQYYRVRRFDDAIAACKQALRINPELAEPWTNIAASYYALGKNNDAIGALREAIRLRPDLTIAKSNLDFLLSRQAQNQPAAR